MGSELVVRRMILRVVKDFPNPQRDKRCKYGFESLDKIPAGALIDFYERVDTDGITERYRRVKISGREEISLSLKAADWARLQTFCEPSEPRTLAEHAFVRHAEPRWLFEESVKYMLKTGQLTIEQVLAAYDASQKEGEDEST